MPHDDGNAAFWLFLIVCVVIALSLFAAAPAIVVGQELLAAARAILDAYASAATALWIPPS